MIPSLSARPKDAHKGMFGHGLIIGGSNGMSGAAILAAKGCMRAGAGLTTVACPRESQSIIAGADPCYMTLGWSESASLSEIVSLLSQARYRSATIACGPGLGRSEQTDALALWLWENWSGNLILDADALNALSESDYWKDAFQHRKPRICPYARIITPHPGEWGRLSRSSPNSREDQTALALEFARQFNMTVVLKGHSTLITDGIRTQSNSTGNAAMAVGGSGDCLTGIIAGLLCQKLPPWEACSLGVYWHGLAGDLAVAQQRTPSVLPTELLEFLPEAYRSIEKRKTESKG